MSTTATPLTEDDKATLQRFFQNPKITWKKYIEQLDKTNQQDLLEFSEFVVQNVVANGEFSRGEVFRDSLRYVVELALMVQQILEIVALPYYLHPHPETGVPNYQPNSIIDSKLIFAYFIQNFDDPKDYENLWLTIEQIYLACKQILPVEGQNQESSSNPSALA
jgi:hypothetical protein